uniref:Uncharacterized protein n=1 Tax=Babesia bovis TaxID=5865 RepID=S6BII2_BABBO|nr:hypothetical protein [Babesia bovis]
MYLDCILDIRSVPSNPESDLLVILTPEHTMDPGGITTESSMGTLFMMIESLTAQLETIVTSSKIMQRSTVLLWPILNPFPTILLCTDDSMAWSAASGGTIALPLQNKDLSCTIGPQWDSCVL